MGGRFMAVSRTLDNELQQAQQNMQSAEGGEDQER
jgi:hypothetical protein